MKESIIGLAASGIFFFGLFWCMSIEKDKQPKTEKNYVELEDPDLINGIGIEIPSKTF